MSTRKKTTKAGVPLAGAVQTVVLGYCTTHIDLYQRKRIGALSRKKAD